jgi:hypothetical protein
LNPDKKESYGGQVITSRIRIVASVSHRLPQGFGALVTVFAMATYFQYDALLTYG